MNIIRKYGLPVLALLICGLLLAHFNNDKKNSKTSECIHANDHNIRYIGRVDHSNEKRPAFAFPGVAICAKFEGPSISVMLKDMAAEGNDWGGGKWRNFYNVLIDGYLVKELEINSTDTVYSIADDLKDTIHSIEIFKLTESAVGKTIFLGFKLENGKQLVEDTTKVKRKIQFIGNSITCGYGVEGLSNKEDFECSTENAYLSYSAITARNLKAEYSAIAYSSKGLVKNYDKTRTNTMPHIYDRILADDPTSKWDHSSYVPDVIAINLGTNDMSALATMDEIIPAYQKLLNTLRSYYPVAKIICVIGPMINEKYPWANALTEYRKEVSEMVSDFNTKGDKNIYFTEMSEQGKHGYGSNWHPNIKQAEVNAAELTEFIQSVTTWE